MGNETMLLVAFCFSSACFFPTLNVVSMQTGIFTWRIDQTPIGSYLITLPTTLSRGRVQVYRMLRPSISTNPSTLLDRS